MDTYRQHGVYKKVPVSDCYSLTGKAPIKVRWVVCNKGDSERPEYRVRLVAKEIKLDHPEIENRPGYEKIYLKAPQWEFSPHGQCGTEVSTLFPYVAQCVDDIALIRSMHTDHSNHYNATLGMHTGSFAFARPSLGSWVSYGLGTETIF